MRIVRCALLWLCIGVIYSAARNCKYAQDKENECAETEYDSYMSCMRSRTKRSTCEEDSCENSTCESKCSECDCSCSADSCSSTCNGCCANFEQPCKNHVCCVKTCHSTCPSSDCRKSCRKTCTDKLNSTHIEIHSSNVTQLHNITTVINLHNVINNTNLIDIPVSVNNTNFNNITVELPTGGDPIPYINYTETNNTNTNPKQQCCYIISPRHCFPTSQYPFVRCAHYRKHLCNNSICMASIMHAQPHQVCDERPFYPPSCHQQVIYIPQPQPRCVYQSNWPYVSCGLQQSNCQGCYSHYTSGGQPPSSCSSACYNEGYGAGPYYRQGPFYRPGYAPVPSCLQIGTCNFEQLGGAGVPGAYDNFGNPALPLNGVGYPPATYENFYSVEADPFAGLNFNSSMNTDMMTEINIPNSELPQLDVVPNLVKIETTKYPTGGDSDASVTITKSDEQSDSVEIIDES